MSAGSKGGLMTLGAREEVRQTTLFQPSLLSHRPGAPQRRAGYGRILGHPKAIPARKAGAGARPLRIRDAVRCWRVHICFVREVRPALCAFHVGSCQNLHTDEWCACKTVRKSKMRKLDRCEQSTLCKKHCMGVTCRDALLNGCHVLSCVFLQPQERDPNSPVHEPPEYHPSH